MRLEQIAAIIGIVDDRRRREDQGATMIKEERGVRKNVLLPPGLGNPRNSEGDLLGLRDGRILFVYTHYYEGRGGDHDPAYLAARTSSDRGETWSERDVRVVENHAGMNVMSVSLLRLPDDEIALFYLRKNSQADCRPVMRISRDEGASWGEPSEVITDEVAYFVMNNDRAVQLASGRLVAPVARHRIDERGFRPGVATCYLSDDNGRRWRRSRSELGLSDDRLGGGLQEPGVIELRDSRLMMFLRTGNGCQYLSFSEDGGESWTDPQPSAITSPLSPASMRRLPQTGDLLLVWNNNYDPADRGGGYRTPYNTAISRDEGHGWTHMKVLEDDPNGWYCYTAIEFVGDRVLLAHCAGDRRTLGLATTQITSFDVAWLYQ